MSLQSELTDLTTNLAAAKAAVVTKGGTVGNTGLAGLEAEILAIPTTRTIPWGEVKYYSSYTPASATTQSSTNLTFNSVSQSGLMRFIQEGLHVTSSQSITSWWWMDNGQLMSYWDAGGAGNIPASYLASEYGINVSMTDQSQSNAQWIIAYTAPYVDKTSQVNSAELSNQSQYNNLAGQDKGYGSTVTIGSATVLLGAIKSFTFGSSPTSVPDYFLNGSGVEEIDWSYSRMTSIGNYFLNGCQSFDCQIILPDTTTAIGNYFLNNCASFDYPITGNGVTTIGSYFLSGCVKFNSRLNFPAVVTIGTYFLAYRSLFDHSLSFPAVTSVGQYFLYQCSKFNSALSMPSLQTAGSWFMYQCYAFNQTLSFPALETIYERFLAYCTSLNSSVTVPAAKTIDRFFLYGSTAFNQNFTIPSTVTSIGANFFTNCNAMVSTITCNCAATVAYAGTTTFGTDTATAACYVTGIKLSGTYKNEWHTRFPDRTSSTYRKTIVV